MAGRNHSRLTWMTAIAAILAALAGIACLDISGVMSGAMSSSGPVLASFGISRAGLGPVKAGGIRLIVSRLATGPGIRGQI